MLFRSVQTADGGFVIAGKTTTNTNGQADMILIKTDANGNMRWAKSYGLQAWEESESLTISHDGNYLICGATTSSGAGSYDILLWKCDTAGNYMWGKTYGGSKSDASYYVREKTDGSIVVAGYTNSWGYGHAQQYPLPVMLGDDSTNIFLMKTDSMGDVIWAQSYGDKKQDEAFNFSQTVDGGYIIPGFSNSYTYSTDSLQMLLIRTDSMGISGCHEQRVNPIVTTAVYTPQILPFTQSRGMDISNVNVTTLPWNIPDDDACLYIGISSPDATIESSLTVFPNPAKGSFTIESSDRKSTRLNSSHRT